MFTDEVGDDVRDNRVKVRAMWLRLLSDTHASRQFKRVSQVCMNLYVELVDVAWMVLYQPGRISRLSDQVYTGLHRWRP